MRFHFPLFDREDDVFGGVVTDDPFVAESVDKEFGAEVVWIEEAHSTANNANRTAA